MDFHFEYVKEEQVLSVIKRVKRNKRIIKEEDEWTYFLSKKENYKHLLSDDNAILGKSEENLVLVSSAYSPSKNKINDELIHSSKNYENEFHVKKEEKTTKSSSFLILKIINLRHKILNNLNALLLKIEKDDLVEAFFMDCKDKFEEPKNCRTLRNSQYQLHKLDYQLVTDMRKLSLHATGDDIFSLLKALSECHSSASKMIQVFLGSRDLLDVDEFQEKFQEILRCLFAFTRICVFVSDKSSELEHSENFLVDEINAKCSDILCSLNKRKLEGTKEKPNERKVSEKLNVDYKKQRDIRGGGSKSKPKNTVYIPLKKFKNLASVVFGPRERREKIMKRDDAVSSEMSLRHAATTKTKKIVKFENDESSRYNANKTDVHLNNIKEKDELNSNADLVSRETQVSLSFENEMENENIKGYSKKFFIALKNEILQIFQDNFSVYHPLLESFTRQLLDEKGLPYYKEYDAESLTRHSHVPETVEVVQYEKVNEKDFKAHSDFDNESNETIQVDRYQENVTAAEIEKVISEQPWDTIGRISDQVIEECIQSLSLVLDEFLDKNVIEPEFHYADT